MRRVRTTTAFVYRCYAADGTLPVSSSMVTLGERLPISAGVDLGITGLAG